MPEHRQITYIDELLADSSVHRRYADGRQEWRTRDQRGVVSWRDDGGYSGTDEPLGTKLVKRTVHNGPILYGREHGFGRTLWSDGRMTVNRSSLGGRVGGILAGVAGGVLLGGLIMPPSAMSAAEEEELRRQAATQSQSSGSSDNGGDYGGWDDDGGDDGGDFG